MSNFRNIIKNHNATYYDYDTDTQNSVWVRYALVSLVSVVLVLFFKTVSSEILGALLTVQSILIGFSFSVMFFLISGSVPTGREDGSIETDLKKGKLARLAKELFYNVSYFNFVALISVLLALLMLLPNIDVDALVELIKGQRGLGFWPEDRWKKILSGFSKWLSPAFEFLLYSALIESLTSFARTVGRVSFYFERRLQIETQK